MAALKLFVLGAVLAVHTSRGNPTEALRDAPHETIIEAATYLARYGYSSSNQAGDKSGSLVSLSSNLEEFQRFAGLEVTGMLDEATVEKMRQPRCGVKDKLGPSYRARRRKRYALQGSRWRTKNLSYKIMSWPSRLANDKNGVKEAIRDSFKTWSDVSGLTFQEVGTTAKANIEIKFASGDHGDGDEFDGTGGTLAHAYFPIYGGDAHFDDSERWKVDPTERGGIDLFTVAAHEFGHSLGLSHSDDKRALMGPFYKPPSPDRDVVKEDDVKGIQELYGPPAVAAIPVPKPREPSRPSNREEPDQTLCTDSSIDAMLTIEMNDGKKRTYAFKGAYYWRLTSTGVEQGYPRRIRDMWGGLPDNLDAIVSYEESNVIFFFKGSQYWRMTDLRMDDGYPSLISRGFPGIPDNIDAAFKWVANGKLYFFKGSQYWRVEKLRSTGEPGVSDQYPQPISVWNGIPNNIDSVFTYENQRTYFFKGNSYYRFNDVDFTVDPSYPRSTGQYWFGCDGQRSNLVTPASRSARHDPAEYDDAVVGFGIGDAQPRIGGSGAAAGLLPSLLLLLLSAVLTMLRC